MKRNFVLLSIALAAFGTTSVWAQGAAATTGVKTTESTDSIVQMRSDIRAANAAYRAKVRAADRVHKQEIDKTWAERNEAVEAARSGDS